MKNCYTQETAEINKTGQWSLCCL